MNSTPSASEGPPSQWELEWAVVAVAIEQFELDPSTVTPDSRLIEDLGIDSLALVELIMALEETFGVSLPDEAAEDVFKRSPVTLRMMASFVRQQWGTGTPPRKAWRKAKEAEPEAVSDGDILSEEVPFTQLGGRLNVEDWQEGPLYDLLGPNLEGYIQYRRRTDGIRCVLIPAAEAWLGSDDPDALPDQQPMHSVRLSAFLMDAEPVSNAAYCRFLNSLGHLPPTMLAEWCGVAEGDRRGQHFPLQRVKGIWEPLPNTERQPMILVSWYGANAYSLWANRCDWRCYRGDGLVPEHLQNLPVHAETPTVRWMHSFLPSEAQWEYAARGGGCPTAQPRSSTALTTRARVALHTAGTQYEADTLLTARVCERLGMSPLGLHHMAGNVWQWCRDWYAPDFYQRPEAQENDPQNIHPTGIRSERGGSWVGPPELAEPWYRRGRPPEARGRCLGFRCVGEAVGLLKGDRL